VDLAAGRPIVPAHTGRGYQPRTRGGAGGEDRPEANQIRREVAEAVADRQRTPVSRLSAPNGGASAVFVQWRSNIVDRAAAAIDFARLLDGAVRNKNEREEFAPASAQLHGTHEYEAVAS
jgi:hypothetical protein